MTQYDVWAAQYGSRCTCPLPFGIWQYSSSNPLGIPGYGKSLDCNHVYKDYPSIIQRAGLNGFTAPDPNPAPDLSTMRQILTIGPVTMGDALQIQSLCKSLGITGENDLYTSQWNDTDKILQTITIGPVSSGDAWYIMRLCERLQLTGQGLYFSKYAV